MAEIFYKYQSYKAFGPCPDGGVEFQNILFWIFFRIPLVICQIFSIIIYVSIGKGDLTYSF